MPKVQQISSIVSSVLSKKLSKVNLAFYQLSHLPYCLCHTPSANRLWSKARDGMHHKKQELPRDPAQPKQPGRNSATTGSKQAPSSAAALHKCCSVQGRPSPGKHALVSFWSSFVYFVLLGLLVKWHLQALTLIVEVKSSLIDWEWTPAPLSGVLGLEGKVFSF